MHLRRIATSCVILAATGGCSHLVGAPAQYTALPPEALASMPQGADPQPLVIPGTLLKSNAQPRGVNVNPFKALQRADSAQANWEKLRPANYVPSFRTAGRSNVVKRADPAATASLAAADMGQQKGNPERPNVDGDLTMNRLLKDGEVAAKPICARC